MDTTKHPILIGWNALTLLDHFFRKERFKSASVYILVDGNTARYCLPLFLEKVKALKISRVIKISSGEKYKNIEVCTRIWRSLSRSEATRSSVLINLGGGVITDIGGFAASAFKRGIAFINVPTTLLSQVDASIGGKTGIDFDAVKNEIGLFSNPILTAIFPGFLQTLSHREFLSGYAEIIKHALIADPKNCEKIRLSKISNRIHILENIRSSVAIKSGIVKSDPLEKGRRKILNFGHTIGHALESFFLRQSGKEVLHGEAVAAGMVCESYISHKTNRLSRKNLNEITATVLSNYPELKFGTGQYRKLIELMKHDKKNCSGRINFVLLSKIGLAGIDKTCSEQCIVESFNYYHEQYKMHGLQN